MPKIGGRLVMIGVAVTAVYLLMNFLFISNLGAASSSAEWQSKQLEQARWRRTVSRGEVWRRQEALPVPAAAHPSLLTSATPPTIATPPPPAGPPPPATTPPPPSQPDPRAFVPPPPPRPRVHIAGTKLHPDAGEPLVQKPLILYRTRFREPSGFSQEAIDFVRGLSEKFYVGIQMEGSHIEGYVKSWQPSLRRMIDRYHDRESYILNRPHTLIHHGAAGDFFCEDKRERPMYCIGRAMFETDRVPYSWIDNLATQHQIWVPSTFNVETFVRSGLDEDRIYVVPEPMNLTLFNPDTTKPMKLGTGKKFHFLSVFAWNDRKGWDILLKSYLQAFTREDDVCLVLRTFPKHRNDANFDPEASGEWVHMKVRGAAKEWFQKELEELACIHVIATHLSERDLPRLYKAADAFVLPSRGEGWGRPMTEAMAMELPSVLTNWSAQTEYANENNAWMIEPAGLSCVNSEPRRGNPAGVYASHRWAEASIPKMKTTMRHLFENKGKDPNIAERAAAARATANHFGYEEVNDVCVKQLALVPEKYRKDPDERLRSLYEEVLHRPPSDGEVATANSQFAGWRDNDEQWHKCLCTLCVSREFLVGWEEATMPMCSQCAAELDVALDSHRQDSSVCDAGVDIVYTFASDANSAYKQSRTDEYAKLWMLEKHEIDQNDAVAVQRARAPLVEWLFRMSLRSVAKNAPWVRKIFVVTDTPPAWLGADVQVVPSGAIMPADHLPTFNSHAVEGNLHRIAELSECYIYMNSDYMFGRQVNISDFVDLRSGLYKIYLEMDRKTIASSDRGRPPAAHDAAFKNANQLLDHWIGPKERHFVPHAPHFFRKSIVAELEKKASAEFAATSSHKFRSFSDIHVAYLFSHFLLESPGRMLARVIETTENYPDLTKPTYTVYLFNKPGQPTEFNSQLDLLRNAAANHEQLPLFLSINDAMNDEGSEDIGRHVKDTLLTLYPEQSRFETDVAQLQPVPNVDPNADCTGLAGGSGGADTCPDLWNPTGLCGPADVHQPCQYTVNDRKLSCACCYPSRMTWQCTFSDGGPPLEEEADSIVNPSLYIVKTSWRGRSNRGLDSEAPNVWSGTMETEKVAFTSSYGSTCKTPGAKEVLIALPYDDLIPCPIRERMFEALKSLECSNPGFNLELGLIDDWEKTQPFDWSRRAAIARLRNRVISQFLKPHHDYVLWLDGGVVDYPKDLVSRLHGRNPEGITAPLILVEESDSQQFHQRRCGRSNCGGGMLGRSKAMHDVRSFIVKSDQPISADAAQQSNSNEFPPYFGGPDVVECESVGTVYLAPAALYRVPETVPKYFPTPFTEHFPVMHAAKYKLGMRIVTDTNIVVQHADTAKFGPPLSRISDESDEWKSWLRPLVGHKFEDPAILDIPVPSFWKG